MGKQHHVAILLTLTTADGSSGHKILTAGLRAGVNIKILFIAISSKSNHYKHLNEQLYHEYSHA